MTALLAKSLSSLGLNKGDRIGIISPNRTEWSILDFACSVVGIILVPLYDTQSQEDIAYVAKDAAFKMIFCAAERLHSIQAISKDLTQIVVFDDRLDDRAALI